jgi:pimeloyl-ACP methyl ester carboxylesterase
VELDHSFNHEYDEHHLLKMPMNHTQASPSSAVERAAVAFLTPRAPKERRDLMLKGGDTSVLKTPEGDISLQSAGSGPTVLLLHGWEGQASDLEAFAHPLLEAGFQVVAMDLPAHGRSEGRQANITQSARALIAVSKALGPLHAVIAHSIGSAMLAEALHGGLEAKRAVMIAAPAHYGQHMRAFAAASGLEGLETKRMVDLVSASIGADIDSISIPLRAPGLRQPALFIHSADDQVVRIEESLESAAAWPGARHERVEGLGHRRLLKDPAVISMAIAFAASKAD